MIRLDDLRWLMYRHRKQGLAVSTILGREDMEIYVEGMIREVHDEEASFEDRATGKVRAYRKQWLSVFVPDGRGMGESVAVTPYGCAGPLPFKSCQSVKIRLRSFEEDKGTCRVSCSMPDIEVTGAASPVKGK